MTSIQPPEPALQPRHQLQQPRQPHNQLTAQLIRESPSVASSSSSRHRRRLLIPGCRSASYTSICYSVFFIVTTACLVTSTTLAAIHWRIQWSENDCEVVSTSLEEDGSRYRVRAQVFITSSTEYGCTKARDDCPAFFATSEEYTLDWQQANKYKSSVQNDGSTSCWVQYQSSSRFISLVRPPHLASVAWSATCVAALSAVLLFTALCHLLQNAFFNGSNNPHLRTYRRPTTPNPVLSLSAPQVKHVSDEYTERVKLRLMPGWLCPICLDDGRQLTNSRSFVINTIKLPCSHRFHDSCITKWLHNFKAACPLCNWNAADSLFSDSSSTRARSTPFSSLGSTHTTNNTNNNINNNNNEGDH